MTLSFLLTIIMEKSKPVYLLINVIFFFYRTHAWSDRRSALLELKEKKHGVHQNYKDTTLLKLQVNYSSLEPLELFLFFKSINSIAMSFHSMVIGYRRNVHT